MLSLCPHNSYSFARTREIHVRAIDRPIIPISSRLKKDSKGDDHVEIRVWKDVTFNEMANYAAKMHTMEDVPFREAMHYFVDSMLDFEFGDLFDEHDAMHKEP